MSNNLSPVYIVGLASIVGIPVLYVMMAHPLLLGGYCIVSHGILLYGLYKDCICSRAVFRTFSLSLLTGFVIIVSGGALFAAAHALVRGESADEDVGRVLLFELVLIAFCPLLAMILKRVRKVGEKLNET